VKTKKTIRKTVKSHMVLVVEHEETADCHQEKIVPLATWQAGFFFRTKGMFIWLVVSLPL
jgi:hypothetical protein